MEGADTGLGSLGVAELRAYSHHTTDLRPLPQHTVEKPSLLSFSLTSNPPSLTPPQGQNCSSASHL